MASGSDEHVSLLIGDSAVQFSCKASSTSSKEHLPRFMFDGDDDSCWNSEQGSPQTINLKFEEPQRIGSLEFMFQGGFAGQDVQVLLSPGGRKDADFKRIAVLEPADNSDAQRFQLREPAEGKRLRIVFARSTDFYGRVVVYRLDASPPQDAAAAEAEG